MGFTLRDGDLRVFNSWHFNGFFFGDISTRNHRQTDGFVNADLLGFRVGNGNSNINRGDNGYIVGSFLSNLLAVMGCGSIWAVSSSLADSDHLHVVDLFIGDFDSLSSSVFSFLLIFVGAHFLRNNFNAFCADSTGNSVGEVNINNDFDR